MTFSADSSAKRFTPSRRKLMAGALAAGVATTAVSSRSAQASESPNLASFKFQYPVPTGPSVALWGSSSIENVNANDAMVAGVDARLETTINALLGLEVFNFGRGGETSYNVATRRGVPDFRLRLIFPDNTIPAKGSVWVKIDDSTKAQWNAYSVFPGIVQDVFGVVSSDKKHPNQFLFTRLEEGKPRYAPAGQASDFYSHQERISRASIHVLQLGRNNLQETELLKEHTKAAFALAPERSIVMGHFPGAKQAANSEQLKQVLAYNNWAATHFGDRYLDIMGWLRDKTQEPWLRYGSLSTSGVWNSPDDQKDYETGNVPRSLYAKDFFHLNGWGYVVVGHMIAQKIQQLGWA